MANILHKDFILLYRLSVMDFRKRYLGTALGGVWAVLSPLVTIVLIYFVMTFGLRVGSTNGVLFIDWLIPGMLAWFYILDGISGGVLSIVENPHLVTKMRFPLRLLPLSKVLTPIFIHIVLMCVFLLYMGVSSGLSVYCLQLFYFLACSVVLCLGIGYFTSALMVFVSDTAHIVGVLLQLLFWATPIFWNASMLSGSRFSFLLYSPFNYIISGYRMCLLERAWIWERPFSALVFWFCALFLFAIGFCFFRKTKRHFADVI